MMIYTVERPNTLWGELTYAVIVTSVSPLFKAMKRLTHLN